MASSGEGFIDWLGVKYRTILTNSETGGKMSITRSISPPNSGPPRHIHHAEDEIFCLTTGRCEFWVDGTIFNRSAGELMFVPRGTPHTFLVPSDGPCDHLTIFTPGGCEGFFAEMVSAQFLVPQDMAQIAQVAAKYAMTFTGPPLTEAEVQR
jgi:quercetin dioxygenase-like cupin family protein